MSYTIDDHAVMRSGADTDVGRVHVAPKYSVALPFGDIRDIGLAGPRFGPRKAAEHRLRICACRRDCSCRKGTSNSLAHLPYLGLRSRVPVALFLRNVL